MSAAPGCEFPNPCPICGATDDHVGRMGDAARYSPATLCPHPSERGHGTGCCCAGVSRETAKRRRAEMLAAPSPLEQRVAALEATVDHLLNPVTPSSPTVFDLLRESVTVVKPGEVLFFTGPEYFTPTHVREVQDMIDWWLAENAPDVKAVVLPHGEFAAAEPAAAEAS